jgi:hypothetical protein
MQTQFNCYSLLQLMCISKGFKSEQLRIHYFSSMPAMVNPRRGEYPARSDAIRIIVHPLRAACRGFPKGNLG